MGRAEVWLRTLAGGSFLARATVHSSSVLSQQNKGPGQYQGALITMEANFFAKLISPFMKSRHRQNSTTYQSLSQSLEDIYKNNPPDCKSCKLSSFVILPCLSLAFLGDGLTVRPVKSNVWRKPSDFLDHEDQMRELLKVLFLFSFLSSFFILRQGFAVHP